MIAKATLLDQQGLIGEILSWKWHLLPDAAFFKRSVPVIER